MIVTMETSSSSVDLDQPTTEGFIQHYAQNIQASRKPSNLKKHLVKSSQNYYAKP